MKMYTHKATNLIVERLKKVDLRFHVDTLGGKDPTEIVRVGFGVPKGPDFNILFIVKDDNCDTAVRVYQLLSNVPDKKRVRVMEACNILNKEFRYAKFCMDDDNDVNVEYDLPFETPDDAVGAVAFEAMVRLHKIIKNEFGIFKKALNTEEKLVCDSAALFRRLRHLEEMMADDNDDDDNDADDDDGFDSQCGGLWYKET